MTQNFHPQQSCCSSTGSIPGQNNNPSAIQVCEQNDTHSEVAKSQANKCSKTLVPLYAGQPVVMYDTLRKIWVPATVIHVLPWDSYQVCTSNGSTYCCTWRHQSTLPKWHNYHTTGSDKTLLLSGTTCIALTCTVHAAHTYCTCNTGNPDKPDSSCSYHTSCSKECPGTNYISNIELCLVQHFLGSFWVAAMWGDVCSIIFAILHHLVSISTLDFKVTTVRQTDSQTDKITLLCSLYF